MGIRFKTSIKVKNNYKNIQKIINNLPKTVEEGILEAVKNTCEYALSLKKGKKEGILFEIVETSSKEVKGRVYTDVNTFPHAWFLEYGTGKYAELPHIGTTKTFIESGYEYWFIPVAKVTGTLNYPIITIQGTQFYIAHGVQSEPYMRPAEFQRRDSNVEDVEKAIYNMLVQVTK